MKERNGFLLLEISIYYVIGAFFIALSIEMAYKLINTFRCVTQQIEYTHTDQIIRLFWNKTIAIAAPCISKWIIIDYERLSFKVGDDIYTLYFDQDAMNFVQLINRKGKQVFTSVILEGLRKLKFSYDYEGNMIKSVILTIETNSSTRCLQYYGTPLGEIKQ